MVRAAAIIVVMAAAPSRASLCRLLIERLGGRYSQEVGIDVDRGGEDVERWFLAASLFGARISAATAVRTYAVLAAAGVHTVADAGARSEADLVALLDEGGYARYDFQTSARLHALAAVLDRTWSGRVDTLGAALREPRHLEAELDRMPGWGPVTVRLFLRELRGVWPGARPELDPRAGEALAHLGLAQNAGIGAVQRLASVAHVDVRDLETALVRLALAHRGGFAGCPGGAECRALSAAANPPPAEITP
jgi:hypothetical protein